MELCLPTNGTVKENGGVEESDEEDIMLLSVVICTYTIDVQCRINFVV